MLVSECIKSALRESNLISIAADPTTDQLAEGLALLENIFASVFGYEVGEKLGNWLVGLQGIDGPLYLQNILGWQAPLWKYPLVNSRLVFNQTEAQTIYFPLAISDGARMGSVVANGDMATYPVVLSGNGFLIEGVATITLDDPAESSREWLFQAEQGNWVRTAPLEADGTFPFPEWSNDYFITRLAMRANPRYGRTADPQTQMTYQRGETQLKAFYAQRITTPADPAALALSTQVYNTWMGTGMGNYGFGFQPGAYGWMGG